ncbi:MAG: hypothetical protein QM703_22790 [Gemmatales bacterium]
MNKLKHRDKMIRYPKSEQESDRRLAEETTEIVNMVLKIIRDKENDEQKKDSVS